MVTLCCCLKPQDDISMNLTQFHDRYGHWAVVAGAAEGLGESYSRALAARGMNLVMVDHQSERLDSLAEILTSEHGISVVRLQLDLAEPDAPSRIMKLVAENDCRLLVYNAAFSKVKPFLSAATEELDNYIDINCRTPIKLVHLFGKRLVNNGSSGGILLMSSLAGLIGMQLVASYAATKAFSWNLAEALHFEWKGNGIDIMACIAGATATPAYLATRPEYGWLKPGVLAPDKVADAALRKLGKKARFIPGFTNRMNYFILTRLMPRRIAAGIANSTMQKMYRSVKNNN